MKRVLVTALSILASALVVLFIVSNRETITLRLWPLPTGILMPQWLFFLLGFLLGLAMAWYLGVVRRIKAHTKRRQAERRASDLEAERARLESQIDTQQVDEPLAEPRPDVPLLAGKHVSE